MALKLDSDVEFKGGNINKFSDKIFCDEIFLRKGITITDLSEPNIGFASGTKIVIKREKVGDLGGLGLYGHYQEWDIGSIESISPMVFAISDKTGGTYPFQLEEGCQSETLVIKPNGVVRASRGFDIGGMAPFLTLTDETPGSSLKIIVDGNKANFYESAGAAGDILTFDLANKRVGIRTTTPAGPFSIGTTASGDYIYMNGRTANSGGTILFNNGTGQNLILAETASDVYTFGKGAAGSAPTNSVIVMNTNTGNVGIGTTPNANAILDVASTTKPFIPPRMTTTQRDAVASPIAGMVIYNSTTGVLNFHNGAAWGAV